MEDNKIINLYFNRLEDAIKETSNKYENYCTTIAMNIIGNKEDVKECVNDVYMKLWSSIPPNRPNNFLAYIGKITRNTAIDYIEKNNAMKRNNGEFNIILDELEDCISIDTLEDKLNERLLVQYINSFLENLPVLKRELFIKRYWYAYSIEEITKHYKMSKSRVKSILFRLRKKLKKHLEMEGFIL